VTAAQVTPPPALQATPLEAFAHQPGTHLAWSRQVASLDSREAHAVFSILVLEDTAQPPDRMRGIRIELSIPESTDAVYLEEETLGVYKSVPDEIGRTIAGFRNSARENLAPDGTRYLGACVFRSDKPPRVHTPGAAYYYWPPDFEGLSLSTLVQGF
jgi:hypothetical protein